MVQLLTVGIQKDGSRQVTGKLITKEELAAMEERKARYLALPKEARSTYTLTDEESCPGWSQWLYNYYYYLDCPSLLCFYNNSATQDSADLYNYAAPWYSAGMCLPDLVWQNNILSEYPGNEQGCLSDTASNVYTTGGSYDWVNFAKEGANTSVTSEESWMNYLWLSGTDDSGEYDGQCIHCDTGDGYTSNCGDVCVDESDDSNNCGSCGNVCEEYSTCISGACTCTYGACGSGCLPGSDYGCQDGEACGGNSYNCAGSDGNCCSGDTCYWDGLTSGEPSGQYWGCCSSTGGYCWSNECGCYLCGTPNCEDD
jgi:hypothetical protein